MTDTQPRPPRFRSDGITHQLRIRPNTNNTGWVVIARSFTGQASATLSQAEAVELAQMLLAGPGEPKWTCKKHQALSVCFRCLTGDTTDDKDSSDD